jgi:hypothetical protein
MWEQVVAALPLLTATADNFSTNTRANQSAANAPASSAANGNKLS